MDGVSYLCLCLCLCLCCKMCGNIVVWSWLVTQGGWVVVAWVAITEQVLNYPPDVRCGGAAMFV